MKIKAKILATKKEKIYSILLILPSIILIAIFVYGFIGWTARVSLSNWKGVMPNWQFIGLKSYYGLFTSERFKIDILNNIFFTVFFVFLCITGGYLLAVLLDRNIRGENIFRSIFLFPLSVSFVVTGIVWRWIFSPESGVNALLNAILDKIGFTNVNIDYGWFITVEKAGPFNLALIPIIIAASWQYVGYIMAMYLAALRGVPEEIREAARVDGANEFQIHRLIILPLLKPITLGAIIILGHISLKIFDLVYVMTGPGPAFVTDFPSVFMFETTFRGNNYSQGASIAIVMLLMVAVLVVPYLISNIRREVEL